MLASTVNYVLITIISIGTVPKFTFSSPAEERTFLAPSTPYKDSIVGGYEASIKDFPYQVALFHGRGDANDIFSCGGSIISENYILTAAHCLMNVQASRTVARVGSSDRQKGTIIRIAEVIQHPGFTLKPIDNDVGLLKPVHPIKFTDVIKPVKLPSMHSSLEDGSIVTVSGWGRIGENKPSSPVLLALKSPVVNFDKCRQLYGSALTKNTWCAAGLPSGGKGTCRGDSGGPAVQNGMQYGIVSWGVPCALPNHPDVFANVAAPSIREFIAKHTGL